jgi:transcription termination/antitermination protein NusG
MHSMQELHLNGVASEKPATCSRLAWYALQTRYQCEKKVDAALRERAFESFAPMRPEVRRWSDRTKLVESPVFPGYMFVRMEATSRSLLEVLNLPGLVRFVTSGRELVAVPDLEIEMVRALTQSKASYEPGPFPVIGERVRVHGGCLQDVEGILVDQNGREEIVISVGAIQRSLKVPLGHYRVERLNASHGAPV